MSWVHDNQKAFVAGLGVVAWVLYMVGPTVLAKAKSVAVGVWPTVRGKANVANLLPLAFVAVVYLWPARDLPSPVIPARQPDIVDTCTASGRALLADALDKFASQKFDNDQAREDAVNEAILDVIEASYVPLNEEIAKAIKSNRVTDCADKIRKGELRSE